MDKYKVKVNPRAIRELDQIYQYIANEKLAPENAKGQVDRIKKSIKQAPNDTTNHLVLSLTQKNYFIISILCITNTL